MGCEFNDDISLTKEDFVKKVNPELKIFVFHKTHSDANANENSFSSVKMTIKVCNQLAY